jgi:hypothetical protein
MPRTGAPPRVDLAPTKEATMTSESILIERECPVGREPRR